MYSFICYTLIVLVVFDSSKSNQHSDIRDGRIHPRPDVHFSESVKFLQWSHSCEILDNQQLLRLSLATYKDEAKWHILYMHLRMDIKRYLKFVREIISHKREIIEIGRLWGEISHRAEIEVKFVFNIFQFFSISISHFAFVIILRNQLHYHSN